jgi:EamA domain-containing membrane protein RarD
MTKPGAKPDASQAAIAQSLSVYFIWGALTLYWKELQGFD